MKGLRFIKTRLCYYHKSIMLLKILRGHLDYLQYNKTFSIILAKVNFNEMNGCSQQIYGSIWQYQSTLTTPHKKSTPLLGRLLLKITVLQLCAEWVHLPQRRLQRHLTESLLLTAKSAEIPGTHFINLPKIKCLVDQELPTCFWTQDS